MTAAELIAELQKLPPYTTVRGYMSTVMLPNDPLGEIEAHADEEQAQEVTGVKWRGFDVVLECDGMCAG